MVQSCHRDPAVLTKKRTAINTLPPKKRRDIMTNKNDEDFLLRLSEELAALSAPPILPSCPSPAVGGIDNGIGELAEKSLHRCLKRCYAPDSRHREVKLGRYVADIYDGERVVEIQTAQLGRLVPKLKYFLSENSGIDNVTVVYPMTRTKYLVWVDPETGEITKPRKGPKKGRSIDALHELYSIREFLGNPRLTVELLLFDLDEYRILCGYSKDRKKGSLRIERIPRCLAQRHILRSPLDYFALFPSAELLPDPFTSADLQKAMKLQSRPAYSAIHLFEALGLICADRKSGRAQLYKRTNLQTQ